MLNMKSLNLYQNKFNKYGVDPRSLLWKSKGAAHQRFRQFWSEIDFNGKSVLDIGCGFGEFGKFLLKRYKDVDYTGIDIVPEFIKNAKSMVLGGKFFVGDYLKAETKILQVVTRGGESHGRSSRVVTWWNGHGVIEWQDPVYDIVVASGVLNSNMGGQNNLAFRKKAIAKMFSLTNDVLAFNTLGGHPAPENDKDSNIWYSDSVEILKYCMTLTRRVILRANYHPKDFTIIMYHVRKEEPEINSG
jgi:SAM-dependent methyltransferase